MEKENDIVVETDGACFLCSSKITTQIPPIKIEPGVSSISEPPPLHSLQYISQYLKIDKRKVFNGNGSVPKIFLDLIETSNLKVELCEGCASIADKFSHGYQQLKKIELDLLSYVNFMQEKLVKLEESPEPYSFDKVATPSLNSIMGLIEKQRILKVLRTETMEKCSKKLGAMSPRVNLPVTNVEEVQRKLILNSSHETSQENTSDGEESQPDGQNPSSGDSEDNEVEILDQPLVSSNLDVIVIDSPPEQTTDGGSSTELRDIKVDQQRPPQYKKYLRGIHPDEYFAMRQRRNMSQVESDSEEDTTNVEGSGSQPKVPEREDSDSEPILEIDLGEVKVDQPAESPNEDEVEHPSTSIGLSNVVTDQVKEPQQSKIDHGKRKKPSGKTSKNKKSKSSFEVSSSSDSLDSSWTQNYTKDPQTGIYTCSICSLSFTVQSGFNYHYQSVHLKMRYKCKICDKEFQHQRSYNRHHESAHLGVTFKCELCDKVCSLKSNLIKHKQSVHFGKRFPCAFCHKPFAGASVRNRHLKICPVKQFIKRGQVDKAK